MRLLDHPLCHHMSLPLLLKHFMPCLRSFISSPLSQRKACHCAQGCLLPAFLLPSHQGSLGVVVRQAYMLPGGPASPVSQSWSSSLPLLLGTPYIFMIDTVAAKMTLNKGLITLGFSNLLQEESISKS